MSRIREEDTQYYQNELNGEWFNLKNDGEIARVQFMYDSIDELEVFVTHKVKIGDKERYVDCLRTYDQPIDDCPMCSAGIPCKPVRFVEMFQHDDEKVKIRERGKQFIAKLQGLFNRYTPLSSYVFEIERHGKAGDKETKYEIFPMDKVDAFDLKEVERAELLGGLILDKSFDEMEVFLQTGNFPNTDDTTPEPPAPTYNRRAPANTAGRTPSNVASNTSSPSRRAGAVQPTQPARNTTPTRQAQAVQPAQPVSRRAAAQPASRRGGKPEEKF